MMRQTVLLLGLLALAACGRTDREKTVDLLHQRLHTQLASATQAGSVTLQDLPDGAQIVFADPAQPAESPPSSDMVEALLDPGILRIGIAAPSTLPPNEADRRVTDWTEAFSRLQLGTSFRDPDMAPAPVVAPSPALSGMTVTIRVVCPHIRNGWGYGNGTRQAACF